MADESKFGQQEQAESEVEGFQEDLDPFVAWPQPPRPSSTLLLSRRRFRISAIVLRGSGIPENDEHPILTLLGI
jgi:hypothetical protein